MIEMYCFFDRTYVVILREKVSVFVKILVKRLLLKILDLRSVDFRSVLPVVYFAL